MPKKIPFLSLRDWFRSKQQRRRYGYNDVVNQEEDPPSSSPSSLRNYNNDQRQVHKFAREVSFLLHTLFLQESYFFSSLRKAGHLHTFFIRIMFFSTRRNDFYITNHIRNAFTDLFSCYTVLVKVH